MFEKATRMKLRFTTSKGSVTTEDLWDLPLTGRGANLNDLAKSLNKQLKEDAEEDFVKAKSTADQEITLKFDIVKHVILVKLNEAEEAKQKADNKARKQMIMGLIAEKEQESLKNKSADELRAMLAE